MVNQSSHQDKAIVLIDGECEFCNKSAQFISKYDKKDMFRFASQQSEIGSELLKKNKYQGASLSTIILLKNDTVYTKTTALIEITEQLVGFPKLFVLLKIIPAGIRDVCYDVFSKYRYKLFGKKENCAIPTQEVRKKFLS